jgi:hypothetical protein
LAALRAIAASGTIATWAVVQSYALVWAGIIAAAQLADVLKDVFPLTARHKALSGLIVSLDALFIEALYEWESVFAGQLSDKEITERRRRLIELRHNIEVENFPPGELHLPERRDLLAPAEKDATA